MNPLTLIIVINIVIHLRLSEACIYTISDIAELNLNCISQGVYISVTDLETDYT